MAGIWTVELIYQEKRKKIWPGGWTPARWSFRNEKDLAKANCGKGGLVARFGNHRAKFTRSKAELPNREKPGGWRV
jgi:hypothetical protein